MKVKVIIPFKDKVTDKVRNTGEIFECDAKRFAEIKKAGNFVVETKETATSSETKLEK